MKKVLIGVILTVLLIITKIYNKIDILLNIAISIGFLELLFAAKKIKFNKKGKSIRSTLKYILGFILLILSKYFISSKSINNKSLFKLLIIVCSSDSFQELAGSLVGRHKIKYISPNKTYEGYLGGYIGILLLHLFYIKKNFFKTNIIFILGIVGDLFFSYLKRLVCIKDYSRILYSHGGVLDRIDSIILPIIFLGIKKICKKKNFI